MVLKRNPIRRFGLLPGAVLGLAVAVYATAATAQSASGTPARGDSGSPAQTDTVKPAAGQQVATMAVQVNVVNVLATVRDKHGKIVNTLTKDDFTLTEDGRPQSVHYFRQDTDLPLTLGLLVDTSMSQRRVLDQERTASRSFVDQMVREDKDKAFVLHFDREVELLQDLTSSREKLASALDQLQTPQLTRTSDSDSPDSDPQSGRGSRRAGTLLYDAVFLASNELMLKQQGRKAVIVLSDGVDRGSKETLETAIESAQRADTVVYSILFKDDQGDRDRDRGGFGGGGGPRIGMGGPGMGGPGMGGGGMGRRGGGRGYPRPEERTDGKKILQRISNETGGRMFEVSKKEPIDGIYTQIEDELRHQYSLGYTPDRAGAPGPGYHKIELSTNDKGLTVQTRAGYYAGQ